MPTNLPYSATSNSTGYNPAMPPHASFEWNATDGTRLRLRPARPDDAARVHASLALISPEARRQRLLATTKGFSEEFVNSLVAGDPARQYAVLVVREESGEEIPVAGGRLVVNEPTADAEAGKNDAGGCEFALTVGDRWQGQGIGQNILYALIAEARQRKLRTMAGDILPDNRSMLTLARHLHFFIETKTGDDTCTATLEIDAPVVKQALAAWRKKMGLMRRRRTNSAASTGTSGEDSRPRPPLLRLAVLCAGLLLIAAVTWLVTG